MQLIIASFIGYLSANDYRKGTDEIKANQNILDLDIAQERRPVY
jgi:hypothetical protein